MSWEGQNTAGLVGLTVVANLVSLICTLLKNIDTAFNCRCGSGRRNVCQRFIKMCDVFPVIPTSHVRILCNFFRNLGGTEKCLKTWLNLKQT